MIFMKWNLLSISSHLMSLIIAVQSFLLQFVLLIGNRQEVPQIVGYTRGGKQGKPNPLPTDDNEEKICGYGINTSLLHYILNYNNNNIQYYHHHLLLLLLLLFAVAPITLLSFSSSLWMCVCVRVHFNDQHSLVFYFIVIVIIINIIPLMFTVKQQFASLSLSIFFITLTVHLFFWLTYMFVVSILF